MSKKKPRKKTSPSKKTTKVATKPTKSVRLNSQLSRKQTLLIASLMGLLGILLYAPSVQYGFVYDDVAVVEKNTYVQEGFAGLGKIWTTSYFRGFNRNINTRAYRPIPLSSFAIEHQFFGLNSKVHHGMNIIYYGLTGFFLVLLLSSLLRQYHFSLPIMATLLFVLHPIHIEVVANIKSRDELLAFLNYIIAFWLLLKYLDTKKILWFGGALVFYILALFSKESATPTIAVIPVALYFFRDMSIKKIAQLTVPFLVAVLGFIAVWWGVVGGLENAVKVTYFDNSLLAAEGFAERSASNILVLGYYWFKAFFPHPLLSDYSYSSIPLTDWADWKVYLSLLTYIGLTAAMFLGIRKKNPAAFAIFYYFATIALFTSVVFPNVSAYNDRFQYNASLGICLLIAWTLYLLMTTKEAGVFIKDKKVFLQKNILPLGIFSLIALLGIVKTAHHLPVWTDRYALFEHDIQYLPNNARMHKNHGGSLARQAMAETDKSKQKVLIEQAIQELELALSIYPRIATGQVHLGNMYFIQKNYTQAEKAYLAALNIDSNSHHAKTNMANIVYRKGRYQESVNYLESLNKARFTKNDYYLLSIAYGKLGENEKAAQYRKLSGR